MRIAWFSPLPPTRSGVCDYTETLVKAISRKADIDVFRGPGQVAECALDQVCDVIPWDNFDDLKDGYDAICYHMGNNAAHEFVYKTLLKHSGCLVLHDWVLHHFFAATTIRRGNAFAYFDEFRYNEGEEGVGHARLFYRQKGDHEQFFFSHPLVRRPLEAASGIIVHGVGLLEKAAREVGHKPMVRIPMYHPAGETAGRDNEFAAAAGIDPDSALITTFGLINPTKRPEVILSVYRRMIDEGIKARLAVVGGVAPSYVREFARLVDHYNLKEEIISTDYMQPTDFSRWMACSDVAVALRYPTAGETSSTVVRLMGAGKPVIISQNDQAGDYPDGTCVKVPVGEGEEDAIFRELTRFVASPRMRREVGGRAKTFIDDEHDLDKIADLYISFLAEHGRPRRDRPVLTREKWLGRALGSPHKELVYETEAEMAKIIIEAGGDCGLLLTADLPASADRFSRFITNPLYGLLFARRLYFHQLRTRLLMFLQFYVFAFLRRKVFRRGLPQPVRKFGLAVREWLSG